MLRKILSKVAFVATASSALALASTASAGAPGAVYALTNSPGGNAVVVYERAGDGSLTPGGSYSTGGAGTGAGLGSQGAVIVSGTDQLLFAVNAGSDTASSFRIHPDGLELADTAAFGDDNITTRTTVLPPVGATSVEGGAIGLSGSAAAEATGTLPVGTALGIGPASVHGRVPAGTQPPAIGSGTVSNDD